ncbi:hypothetical protein [Pseudomonas serbiensis]|nr:hypothetical protein [Pseudomonas sp. KFB-138]
MSTPMPSNRHSIEQYILAKDGNRPDLLRQAFSPEATVEMLVHTDAISFPSTLEGLSAIAQTLVRGFGQTYENVYTFCLGEPPVSDASAYTCKWLVGMTVKETGAVRVGCGQYDWRFDSQSGLVVHLTITIDHMQVSPAADLIPVMNWLQGLGYPWCQADDVIAKAPPLSSIAPVIGYLQD